MKSIQGKSAFFHTLVIVGGSIAGCGGKAEDGSEGPAGDGDASGSGSSGSGAQAGDGDIPLGSGGTHTGSGGGDIIIITSGGTPSTGGSYMGGAHGLGCPPEQWTCSGIPYDCSWQESEILGDCTCDETRPQSQSDCPAGTAFTCMEGVEYDANYENARAEPFACICLPQEDTCREQCQLLSPWGDCYEPTADFAGYLCGCELPVLR